MARIALNDLQVEILTWIRDGTPDGVYEDYRPRIVARALHNRGLVDVSGHGKNWRATLKTGGAYYLEHNDYPPSDDDPGTRRRPTQHRQSGNRLPHRRQTWSRGRASRHGWDRRTR